MSEFALSNQYFEGLIDGIENIGDHESPEKILELNPDLIIAFAKSKNLESLEKIAPTIAIQYKEKNFKEQLLEFGKLFDKEAEAEEWISNWDTKIAQYKPLVQEQIGDQTVSILGVGGKEIYAYGADFARGGEILYGEFQLKAPELIQKEAIDGKGWAARSLEALPDYAGDYIFIEDTADFETFASNPLWKGLPAAKNNRVFPIDENDFFFNDPISLEKQLDFFVEKLIETQ